MAWTGAGSKLVRLPPFWSMCSDYRLTCTAISTVQIWHSLQTSQYYLVISSMCSMYQLQLRLHRECFLYKQLAGPPVIQSRGVVIAY